MLGAQGLRYYRQAQDLVGQGDWVAALDPLDRALRTSPGDPSFQALRLFVQWRLGQVTYRRAVEILGALGASGGRSGAQALHLLGRIYLSDASPAAAEDCYWLAHEHQPSRRDSSASATALALAGHGWDLVATDDEDFIEATCEGALAG